MDKIKIVIGLSLIFLTQGVAQTFHDHDNLGKTLHRYAAEYPDLITVNSIARSAAGRELWLARVSATREPLPAVLVVAGVEGSDLASGEICLDFIRYLAERNAQKDTAGLSLSRVSYYIIPRANPDAAERFFQNPLHATNVNARPMDDDNDGKIDEDGVEDLNGDDIIAQMCVRDAAGEWTFDAERPGWLRQARPEGEKGEYILYNEGRDNDKDGKINEDGIGGEDINMNFSYRYKAFARGAGFHPMSAAETRAIADVGFQHPEIAIVFSFSPNHNILIPWRQQSEAAAANTKSGHRRTPVYKVLNRDHNALQQMADYLKKMLPLSGLPKAKTGTGALSEWAYFHYGRWSLSTPAWFVPTMGDSSNGQKRQNSGDYKCERYKIRTWLQQNHQKEAILAWEEIDHPDFPNKQVMVGGIRPFAAENPPADSLAGLSKRFIPVLQRLSTFISQLQIITDRVERLSNGLYRLRVRVVNQRFLPTHTGLSSRMKWSKKIKLMIHLSSGQKIVEGKPFYLIDRIGAFGSTDKLGWIISADQASSLSLTASNPMVISDTLEIELK